MLISIKRSSLIKTINVAPHLKDISVVFLFIMQGFFFFYFLFVVFPPLLSRVIVSRQMFLNY